MVEINKRGRNQQRKEDPQREHQCPRLGIIAMIPDEKKDASCEEFDGEITNGNRLAAFGAFAAQNQPREERDILAEWNLCFAVGAEGAFRFIHAQTERQAINDDIEKRADARAEDEREYLE